MLDNIKVVEDQMNSMKDMMQNKAMEVSNMRVKISGLRGILAAREEPDEQPVTVSGDKEKAPMFIPDDE